MYENLQKESFEKLKERQYKGTILIKCKCGQTKKITRLSQIFRGYCKNCRSVIAADYMLTSNVTKINWNEFEYLRELKSLNKKKALIKEVNP